MKKCRSLAVKLKALTLIFAVIVSLFFYVPMYVDASVGETCSDSDIALMSADSTSSSINNGYYKAISLADSQYYDFSSYLDDGEGLYKITCTIVPCITTNIDTWWNALTVYFNLGELYQQTSVASTGAYVTDYTWTTTRVFYLNSSDSASMRVSYKGVANFGTTKPSSFTVNCSYTVSNVSAERVTVEDSEQYEAGYSAGYSDGEESGYDSGYDSGYNAGFDAGKDSVDTDSCYDSGYNAGYDTGFDVGKDSVDTDAYYNAGYEAGYSVAYDEGYAVAYDEAYSLGYQTALNDLMNDSVISGSSQTKSFTLSISNSSLDIEDVNTLLPVVYDYDFDIEYELEDSTTDYHLEWFYSEAYDEYLTSDSYSRTDFYSREDFAEYACGLGYYLDGRQKLFTASSDAYAYRVTISQSGTSFSTSDVLWSRIALGQSSELLEGKGSLGFLFKSGATNSYTFFVNTDNLPIDVYCGVLFYFFDSDETSASYSLSSTLKVEYIPYTRNEYNQIIQSIDDLKMGYDDSVGDSMNDDFSASVNDYQTAEDSLFSSAKDGLDGFNFVNIADYPTLVTALSFTTSLMSSLFIAVGGESGGIGIVLSVLFSIMLVSMFIGLYKYYQSSGRGGDG